MAAPPMSEKEYKKLTKTQKKVYWVIHFFVASIIICLWVYAWIWQ